jgi:hypothetical protein
MARHRFQLQLIAFVAIMAAAVGLYFSVSSQAESATWALLAVTAAAMLLAVWV